MRKQESEIYVVLQDRFAARQWKLSSQRYESIGPHFSGLLRNKNLKHLLILKEEEFSF